MKNFKIAASGFGNVGLHHSIYLEKDICVQDYFRNKTHSVEWQQGVDKTLVVHQEMKRNIPNFRQRHTKPVQPFSPDKTGLKFYNIFTCRTTSNPPFLNTTIPLFTS